MSKPWCAILTCLAFAAVCPPLAAQATGDYAADLARVYGAYQRLLAMKDGCGASFPDQRAVYDKAFDEWETRHRPLLQDLDKRLMAMIRRASADEKEYGRNFGKYEGAILEQRQEFKETFLSLGAREVRQQCRQFPAYLKGPDADFRKKYGDELQTIGRRKLID
jgi:hypothetical protein